MLKSNLNTPNCIDRNALELCSFLKTFKLVKRWLVCKISTVSVNKLCFFSFLCVFDDVVQDNLPATSHNSIDIHIFLLFLQTGLIQLLDQSLFLQPLPSHLLSDSNSKSHLVIKRSIDDEAMENEFQGDEKNNELCTLCTPS